MSSTIIDREQLPNKPSRPSGFEERYRLYVDESGDHVFRDVDEFQHRFLCLLGCWFRNPDYLDFHTALENLKARFFPHHPDEPVVLHREDMINARKVFKNLQSNEVRAHFDNDLLRIIDKGVFRVVAVVIDKSALRRAYGEAAAHPYHLGLGFLLQRYAGYLNHLNRVGDVMAEARGGKEDRLLKESYTRVYEHGVWMTGGHAFQTALSSRELKLKLKSANIAGLQLADILGHPVKQWVLRKYGLLKEDFAPFSERLITVAFNKFNRHLYDGRVEEFGYVLYPKK
jgi:hypothetical protein